MENSSLKVLWDHTVTKTTCETKDYKMANGNFVDKLDKVGEIDKSLMFEMEEAASGLIAVESYEAFISGFREAVGLLMGCER